MSCSVSAVPSSVRWAFNFREWKPSQKEWDIASRCVQKEEKDRIHRFVYADDAKASMIGQLLMRKAASDCTGIPYDQICFLRTESGKPFLANHFSSNCGLKYNFSLSHHGDFCVLAAQQGGSIGIDIMKIEYNGSRPLNEYFNLMKKQFSLEEFSYITASGTEYQQLSKYYRLWCLKESYVKAKGTGISCNLSAINFHCPTDTLYENTVTADTKMMLNGIFTPEWKFEEMLLNKNHCVAVALQQTNENLSLKGGNTMKFTFLNYCDLMKNCVGFENVDEKEWLSFQAKKEKTT